MCIKLSMKLNQGAQGGKSTVTSLHVGLHHITSHHHIMDYSVDSTQHPPYKNTLCGFFPSKLFQITFS